MITFISFIKLFFVTMIVVTSMINCGGNKADSPKEPQASKKEMKEEAKAQVNDMFVLADMGNLRTLDPSVAYDNTSSQRLWNIYEPLIFFDGSHTGKFKPVLCTEVPSLENGRISTDGKTYTFTIRKGVKFQQGGDLTPEDVAYSFKRNMLSDPDGGPMWMLIEALISEGSTRDKEGKLVPGIFEKIDKCVTVEGDNVVFRLAKPYPPFMGILAYSSSVILDKEWAIENGCWDGVIANAKKFNNPDPGHEPLQKIANGTGPYAMKSWEPNKEFVFERWDGYWGKKPSIKTAMIKYVPEWSTRKLMLQNGDADRVIVDMQYLPEVEAMANVKIHKVPALSLTCAFFCQKVNKVGNSNIGSGKLDGKGIPPTFFNDINVRKAFLHAFDRETYKKDVFNNLVVMPTGPNIQGLPHYVDAPVYEFDLEKSKEYMKKAWKGQAWKKGFKMVITHNTGNEPREAAAHMIAENIMSLNPKFKVEVNNVEWKDYLVKYRNFQYPIFIIGWGADYADPHNFVYTFMHSRGVYGRYMAYKDDTVDMLCQSGIETIDPVKRAEIYKKLQNLWYTHAIGIPLSQPIEVRAYRDNISGFVPNAMLTTANEMLMNISKN